MGRKSKPYWWEEKQAYSSKVNGKRYRLGTTLREATEALKTVQKQTPIGYADAESLTALFEAFLDWIEENRSPKTHRGYKDFCQSFEDKYPRLKVHQLDTKRVTEWLKEKKSWNSTTKNNAITCLQRVMNWSKSNWGLTNNPLQGMEKPPTKRRELIIEPKAFQKLLKKIRDESFRELLIVSDEVGARPQEVKRLEARHVDLKNQCWFIPKEEVKGKKRPRTVYMTGKALAIVRKRVKEHPTGPLFLNAHGNPWTASAVKCRFARLEEKLGVRYCQYNFRHGWVTRKLIAGVDSHVVAALAGHVDTTMIDKFYSKVAADHKFMLKEAKRG